MIAVKMSWILYMSDYMTMDHDKTILVDNIFDFD